MDFYEGASRCKVCILTDTKMRLARSIRNRVADALINQRAPKKWSAKDNVGCSIEELRSYLEAKFYPNPKTGELMSWENWSKEGWHIDHVKPLARFDLTDRQQFLQACHYTNLQPLWAWQNLQKWAHYSAPGA